MSSLYPTPSTANVPDGKIIFSVCRLCAKFKPSPELLNLPSNTPMFQRCLTIISDLKIDYLDFSEQSYLPKLTCNDCFRSLVSAHNFLKTVKQSQEHLKNLYCDVRNKSATSGAAKIDINPASSSINSNIILDSKTDTVKQSQEHLKNLYEVRNKSASLSATIDINPTSSPINSKIILDSDQNDYDQACNPHYNDSSTPKDQDVSVIGEEVKVEIPLNNKLDAQDIKILYVNPTFDSKKLDNLLEINPVLIEDDEKVEKESWLTYKWICLHCKTQFQDINELRGHSKAEHEICFAYNCVDCTTPFYTFNAFIQHVKEHRVYLRRHCQYCNEKFQTQFECSQHIWDVHRSGDQKVCDLCGEILPNYSALERHKATYKKHKIERYILKRRPKKILGLESCKNLSWANYDWTCQDCLRPMDDADSLRAHARDAHNKCFAMKCMDCLKVMNNFRSFVDHASGHRPYLKDYCQYCNVSYKNIQESLCGHVQNHLNGPQKPCDGCGQIFKNNELLSVHMKQYQSPRPRGTLKKEDLVCDICNKQLSTTISFRNHRKTHEADRIRDHICDICGKSFFTQNILTGHMMTHDKSTEEVCKICSKVLRSKVILKHHVKTHMETYMDYKPFTCDTCGKCFRRKGRLQSHIASHDSRNLKYKCIACGKRFRRNGSLKTHEHQHTGIRPFACKYCEKTFTNWANCNKHMIRKHGETLSKTKMTPQGRVEIDQQTGEPKILLIDDSAKEWIEGVVKKQRAGKKPLKVKCESV